MKLRVYTPEDRAACLALLHSNTPRFFKPSDAVDFLAFLDNLPGPYFVIEQPGEGIVGCGGYAIDEDEGHLCWGMVRQDLHGRRMGRFLFDERMRHMRAAGAIRRALLKTTQLTTGFYEKQGFRTVNVIAEGYGPGLDRCDMVKELE